MSPGRALSRVLGLGTTGDFSTSSPASGGKRTPRVGDLHRGLGVSELVTRPHGGLLVLSTKLVYFRANSPNLRSHKGSTW